MSPSVNTLMIHRTLKCVKVSKLMYLLQSFCISSSKKKYLKKYQISNSENAKNSDIPQCYLLITNNEIVRVRYLLIYGSKKTAATSKPQMTPAEEVKVVQRNGFMWWCRKNPLIVSAFLYVSLVSKLHHQTLNPISSHSYYCSSSLAPATIEPSSTTRILSRNFSRTASSSYELVETFPLYVVHSSIYYFNKEMFIQYNFKLMTSTRDLVVASHELREEILRLDLDRLLPVAHNVALLFPDLNRFFELHLSLDDQHIDDANIGDVLVFQELFLQLLAALLL